MRTVLTQLTDAEKGAVQQIAKDSKLKGREDIVEDIYGFLKDPKFYDDYDITEQLIKEFAHGKFEWYLPTKSKVKGRIEFFDRLLHHSFYPKFKMLNNDEATATLMNMLNAFYKKEEDKQPGGSGKKEEDPEEKEFEDIIKYGIKLFDLLDDDCFKQVIQQHYENEGKDYNKASPEEIVNTVINELPRETIIYELSQRLEFTIRTSKTGKYNDVIFPDNGLDISRITQIRDLPKVLPTQLALDDDTFWKKLANKELLKKRYMQRQEKRQILYILLDRSGSMGDYSLEVNKGGYSYTLTKLEVCKAITIAIMKKMIAGEDYFYFRWFEDSPHNLKKVCNKEDAAKFVREIMFQHSTGGTDIMLALQTAANDINVAKANPTGDKIDQSDIVLISDGYSNIDVEKGSRMLNGIDLHSIIVAAKNGRDKEGISRLRQLSKNFLCSKMTEGTEVIEVTNLFTK